MIETISVKDLDNLVAEIALKEAEKEVIAETLSAKNKEISSLELRATEILKSLERSEYTCPQGKIKLEEKFNVKNPTDENKHLLWDWMKSKGIFERYAQVHAGSLKTLFKKEREIAIENGEDPITFALPGMEPATIFEKLEFKAVKRE